MLSSSLLFFNLAGVMFVVGFVVADMVLSRALFALGAAAFVYGFAVDDVLNPVAIIWFAIFFIVNLMVIARRVRESFETPLTEAQAALHARMTDFSRADFGRLMAAGQWQTLEADQQLTEQGVVASHLYYIVSGGADIDKNGAQFEVGADLLIGEISFTQHVPATATVTAKAGSQIIAWPVKPLGKLMKRRSLKAGFDALLSQDLLSKMAADSERAAQDA